VSRARQAFAPALSLEELQPVKTSADDARIAISFNVFFKIPPRNLIGNLLRPHRIEKIRFWGIITLEGNKI
jgi:hypothetical protein